MHTICVVFGDDDDGDVELPSVALRPVDDDCIFLGLGCWLCVDILG